jgi:hypothetical protein
MPACDSCLELRRIADALEEQNRLQEETNELKRVELQEQARHNAFLEELLVKLADQ